MSNITNFTNLNQKTMSSREVAELTGKDHAHVMRDIRNMLNELGVGEVVASSFGGYYIADNGKQNPLFNLPKRETLILVSGYSAVLRAKIVDRWAELEARVALAPAAPHSYADALAGTEIACRMLNLEGSAKLGMLRRATEIAAPHLLPMLPVYAIDAPRNEQGALIAQEGPQSSEPTAALTTLLALHDIRVTPTRMNLRLEACGFLERRTRPSTAADEVRPFWTVTAKGARYGKNIVDAQQPRETKPHWFTRSAPELFRLCLP